MTVSAPTPATHEQARQQRLERAHEAGDRFSRLNGEVELRTAILALLLPEGSRRAVRAWRVECKGLSSALDLQADARSLPAAARLPWFEMLVSRMRPQPLAARQRLLEATRRVMGARGVVRPIDRLHWLAMRQRLGGESRAEARAAAATDLSQLPQGELMAIATYTAFLSTMVPVDAAQELPGEPAAPGGDAPLAPGVAWYETVMGRWPVHAGIEACQPPGVDGLVHALQELQGLAWMHRPVLVRGWFVAAQQHSLHGRLTDGAADALRLSASLLDSPLPPELARHYAAAAPENA